MKLEEVARWEKENKEFLKGWSVAYDGPGKRKELTFNLLDGSKVVFEIELED